MKPRHFIIGGVVLAAILYLTSCLWWGVWINWESKYDLKNLAGLTPAQVDKQLGPAYYDPRLPPTNWKNEQQDGPLALGYNSGAYYITVGFSGGKVVRVDHYTK